MGAARGASVGAEYTVHYTDMRGVDFSSSAKDGRRFSHLENMYRDYDGEGAAATESIPGFRSVASFGSGINGIFCHKSSHGEDYLIVHAGEDLYALRVSDVEEYNPHSLGKVQNVRSRGFNFGGNFYLLDGENLTRVTSEFKYERISDAGGTSPYIPTTYRNGVEFEQQNLMTRRFFERHSISLPELYSFGTEELIYEISDPVGMRCRCVGGKETLSGDVYIPSYVKIGDDDYLVSEISDRAFIGNTKIERVFTSDGILKIGNMAFAACTSLTEVRIADTVSEIGERAFFGCSHLASLYLGSGLASIGDGALIGAVELSEIVYALDSDAFQKIAGYAECGEKEIIYDTRITEVRLGFEIKTPCQEILSVKLNGADISWDEMRSGDFIRGFSIDIQTKAEATGAQIELLGLYGHMRDKCTGVSGFLCRLQDGADPSEIIRGCTVFACFDGRVFLSGNPEYPNSVFFSGRSIDGQIDPTYFGVMDYFDDGVGDYPVISLLAAGDSLAVFKSGDDGCGTIFYHTPKETGIDTVPKIYPVSYLHSGICAIGDSISFFDDPIFISALGITALDKKDLSLDRSIAIRSHNVNPRLLSEDLSSGSLAGWCGYLVCQFGEHIYLADSRSRFVHETGSVEYEWYYLSGIGTYEGDDYVYRYAPSARHGYKTRGLPDEVCHSPVFSAVSEGGETVYYSTEDYENYEVYRTEEKIGGDFSPARVIFSVDDKLLFFGTESGRLCLFNNDKRDFRGTGDIPTEYYSFAGHAPRYALTTVSDSSGIPHLTKSSIKNSLTVKFRSFGRGRITVEVGTNGRGHREALTFPDASLDFSALDFSSLAFLGERIYTLPIYEKEKGWIEKQISIYTEHFTSPFGVYSISYRFRIKGRIKKTRV